MPLLSRYAMMSALVLLAVGTARVTADRETPPLIGGVLGHSYEVTSFRICFLNVKAYYCLQVLTADFVVSPT